MSLLLLLKPPPAYAGSAGLSGDGSLGATSAPSTTDVGSLSGSGTLTATGATHVDRAGELSGDGSLQATGAPAPGTSGELSGSGALEGAVGPPAITGATAALSGEGGLAGSGVAVVATVDSLSVKHALEAGTGTTVLTGTGFTGATAVDFGATPATSFTVDSDTQITATIPAGVRGTVNVRVTNGGSQTPTAAGNRFFYMHPFEAVPAGGVWSTAATWAGGAVPTASSDTYLGEGSGTVTSSAAMNVRSLDCLGYTASLSVGSQTLNIGDATAPAGGIALRLSTAMTLSTPAVLLKSTHPAQQSVTPGGKAFASFTVNGAGSSYLLLGDLASSVTLTSGSLDFNGYNQTVNNPFTINGTGAKTLSLGSASIACSGWTQSGSNLTVTANTATLVFSNSFTFTGLANTNWQGLSLSSSSSTSFQIVNAGQTFKDLTLVGQADCFVSMPTAVTFTGDLSVTGHSNPESRGLLHSTTLGTTSVVSAATAYVHRMDVRDITGAGTASWDFSANLVGDGLGNSNITFPAPISIYAKMTSNASLHNMPWRTTSGGSTTARYPLLQDQVYFDANSGAFTVTFESYYDGRFSALDFTGFTGTFQVNNSSVETYGSLKLSSGMTTNWTDFLDVHGGPGQTSILDLRGQALSDVRFRRGDWRLDSALTTTGSTSSTLARGSLDTNGQAVSLWNLTVSAGVGLTLGTSTLTLRDTSANVFNAAATSLISAAQSTITLSATSSSARDFAGGGHTYGTLNYTVGGTGSFTIIGNNTFDNLNVSGAARTLFLPSAGTTTIISSFNIFGAAGALVTLQSSVNGSKTFLHKKGSGRVVGDYLAIRDTTVTSAPGVWYATNSTNTSNNTGWTFGAPPADAGHAGFYGDGILAGSSIVGANVGLTGSGLLTGDGTPAIAESGGLSGSGALDAVSFASSSGDSNLSGEGSLTGSGTAAVEHAGSGALSGSGSLSGVATAELTMREAATLGTVTVSPGVGGNAPVDYTATGIAMGTATVTPGVGGNAPVDQIATGLAFGSMVAQAAHTGSSGLSGEGSLSGAGTPSAADSGVLSGSGALSAVGAGAAEPAALSGEGSLLGGGAPAAAGPGALSGDGALTATAVSMTTGSAALAGDGALVAAAVLATALPAALSGDGVLTGRSSRWVFPDAILTQTNLTGVVADIQNMPEAPNTYLLGSGPITLRVSFPTPLALPPSTKVLVALRSSGG